VHAEQSKVVVSLREPVRQAWWPPRWTCTKTERIVQEVLQEDEVVKVKVRERATTTVLSNRRVEDLERQGLKGMFTAANCSAVVWLCCITIGTHQYMTLLISTLC